MVLLIRLVKVQVILVMVQLVYIMLNQQQDLLQLKFGKIEIHGLLTE